MPTKIAPEVARPVPTGRRKSAPFPDKDQIRRFIAESPGRVGKREIARAFSITDDQRAQLREMLRELREEGVFNRRKAGRAQGRSSLPNVCVLEVDQIDSDGELRARPLNNTDAAENSIIYLAPTTPSQGAPGVGDRVLARLERLDGGNYQATAIRVLDAGSRQVIGLFSPDGNGGRIQPADRRARSDYLVASDHCADAKAGELVLAEILPGRHLGLPRARVTEHLGNIDDPNSISLLAIHANFIPTQFSDAALAQADAAQPAALDKRTDLRALPLVTIDGIDAHDFDDAVWAEADGDPANPGGWHILVAIADVAHYVRHGDALDHDARERGNSVYLPDRVVPMLPEALSNGLCSLKPEEDRACLAVHIYLSQDGEIRRHEFVRALMRSSARLNYAQLQKALDGHLDDALEPLMASVVAPIYSAYLALETARRKRGTLELDLPEREIILAPDGSVTRISQAPRYDSHKLIEEFMIAANVAAAETLEAHKTSCVYRVHDQPDAAKLEGLREMLAGFGLKLSTRGHITPLNLNQILAKAADGPNQHLISTLVLRAQARAEYSPHNFGHFGLALKRYAHFTSPIRRYADLLVHRALIAALGFGEDGLPPEAETKFAEVCVHISQTERRAVAAERDANDRYTTAYLATHVGADFPGRVSGVARFGLFVELDESGANGLIPARSLGATRPRHDPARHSLSFGATHVSIGDRVVVRLADANTLTGGMIFELLEVNEKPWKQRWGGNASKKRGRAAKASKRGKRRRGK